MIDMISMISVICMIRCALAIVQVSSMTKAALLDNLEYLNQNDFNELLR